MSIPLRAYRRVWQRSPTAPDWRPVDFARAWSNVCGQLITHSAENELAVPATVAVRCCRCAFVHANTLHAMVLVHHVEPARWS